MDRGNSLKRKTFPKENAGFFSLLTFSYLLKFVHRGWKREIEEHDLYNVMHSFRSKKLGDSLEKQWHKQKAKKDQVTVLTSLISCYGGTLLFLGACQGMVKIIHIYTMPWALGKFVSYFQETPPIITRDMALFYAAVLVTVNFLSGLWDQHFTLMKIELGIKMQAAVSSLLYRKSLRLSQSKLSEISTGKIVTCIVKDVSCLNNAVMYGVDFVMETFQVGLVCYMLYDKVGFGSIGGLGIMGLSLVLQIASSRITYTKRDACNARSDQRLQQTQEVLSSIRLIKMYRWESFFRNRLTNVRKYELSNLQSVFIWKSISIILGIVSGKIAQASVFALYIYLGNVLTAEILYYIQQLFNKIAKAMIFIPLGIQTMAEFMISVRRIDVVLNAEENNLIYKSAIQMLNPEINLIDVDVNFGKRTILKNINLKLKSGLHILIGPSGCGKSTLIKAILEEYNTSNGKLKVQGTISYAPQTPWLFASTVKQNILFGLQYDAKKYNKVVEICGLNYDFGTFLHGDETVLTDCGANLSKGQQARINLARAIYRESDIYLLDDSLASLDINIKNSVFNNAVKNYLKNKLCLLVTHSTKFVNRADSVIVMSDYTVKYVGKPDRIPSELFQRIEEDQNDDVDETTAEDASVIEKKTAEETSERTELLRTAEKGTDGANIYGEKKKAGRVTFNVYKSYFKYGGGLIMVVALVGLHIICELSSGVGEKFLSQWVNNQGKSSINVSATSNNSLSTSNSNDSTTIEDLLYSYTTESLILNQTDENIVTTESFLNSTTYNESMFKPSSEVPMDMFNLYILAIAISTIFVVIRCFLTYYYTIKVSKNMHKSMITNILQGTMAYFDTHLIGNILTRFSKDLYIMDELVPFIWLEGFRLFFLLPICLLLIATVSLKLAIASVILTIFFLFLCEYILKTTRSTQRLSNSTLSPVIGHLNASLAGIMVIRAYGSQHILKNEFDKHQDLFISANHTREIAVRVLGISTHTIATLFTAVLTLGILYFNTGAKAGDVGLVMSQSSMLIMLLEFGLIMWMIMENSMTCVERALEYTKLPQEHQTGRDLEKWPESGGIKFQNVTLTYSANGDTVLKDLNFKIHPQEKIGIVGRTGAGKSSIIVTLFKMYNFSGDILIDNVNIRTISLECLRSHLAIIPQDPVIFTGTVRTNIDPYKLLSDQQIWSLLETVNLKACFDSLDDDIVKQNLSIGQKQLICLARAITKKSKIVILDEATANMDEEMDKFIQNKIRELFQFCTVITVAHRLHTVRSCDRIIVMDKGKIVEFDTPQNLLNNTDGMFYKMVHQKTKSAISSPRIKRKSL